MFEIKYETGDEKNEEKVNVACFFFFQIMEQYS